MGKKIVEPSSTEQLQTKYDELLESIVEAGNAAKWEENSTGFDPEDKDSIIESLEYYGKLLDKANKHMVELREKVKEVFKDS
jgi:hypothetical protein